jgi:peptide deformylase
MAVLPIRTLPDPILRQKAKRVRNFDNSISKLVDDMIETMKAAPGVGLAAPQVGVPLRVIVIGMPDEEAFCLINPEVVKKKGERVISEGCLSVPGYVGMVPRAESVTVKGRDRTGKEVRIKGDELLAQALEHEIDHTNGIVYVDLLESPDDLKTIEQVEAELREEERLHKEAGE